MDSIWWFIVGIVIGGLALWIFMRERVLRLEAELASRGKKGAAETAPAKVEAPPAE